MTDEVSPLLRARYENRLNDVEALLAANPELDVFEAAAVGRTERVRELLEREPELARAWSPDGFTALHLASFFGHPEIARLLLDRGADPAAVARNAMLVQPLHSAAAGRNVEIARMLLERGADPNARQQRDFTPMDAAVENGEGELVELLRAHGADVSP